MSNKRSVIMNTSVKFLLLSAVLASTMFGVFGQPDEKRLKIRAAMEAGCYNRSLYGANGKQAIGNPADRWPGAVVPYTLADWGAEEKKVIQEGMNMISSKTCIQFTLRTTEEDYIFIETGENKAGCSSLVGMEKGKQSVNLATNGCVHAYIVAHELLHALGINHEQCRTDRDDYVQIIRDNIEAGMEYNFAVDKGTKTFELPYDFESIMHYVANAFAIDESKDTIVSKVPGKQVRRDAATEMSENDIKKLKALYECK